MMQNNLIPDTMISDKYLFFWDSVFSQWYPCTFKEENIVFSSAEQYMMFHKAMLFNDKATANKILETQNPREQKALGRTVKNFSEEAWGYLRLHIVVNGNILKFSQNEDLLQYLNAFDKEFVEASPEDPIWGIGMYYTDPRCLNKEEWQGLNLLGKALNQAKIYINNSKGNI